MWAYEPGKIDVAYIITMLIIRDLPTLPEV